MDSYVDPEPWDMPGYDSQVLWQQVLCTGSSIELSADGPVKPPYAVYFQGDLLGTCKTWSTDVFAETGRCKIVHFLKIENMLHAAADKGDDMSEKTQVIVVGGGASGLAAAIAAAENGAAVTLLEQNENPGRKICVTGNGRCNLTNRDMRPDIFRGQHPEFVEEILAQFTLEDTLAFLKNLGWLLQNVMDGCIPEAIRRNVFRNSCF